jgi:ABC-type antimicrobial peptide transport system permease subunit
MIEHYIIGLLTLALVIQSTVHHLVTQKLLNKLMSRNYYEYATTKKYSKEKEKKKQMSVQFPVSEGQNELGVLDELHNSMIM